MNRFQHRVRIALVLAILCTVCALAQVGAFQLRFDFSVPITQRAHLLVGILVAVPAKLLVFYITRSYRGWWSYAGTRELLHIAMSTLAASAAFGVSIYRVFGSGFPRSIYILDWLLTFLGISALRLVARVYHEAFKPGTNGGGKQVLVYGAGWAGVSLVRELQRNDQLGYHIAGLIDDDQRKRGERVLGVPVLGSGRDILHIVQRARKRNRPIEEILIAIPTATGRQMREVIANCRAAGLSCRTLPSLGDLLQGRALRGQVRQISVEDLLGRDTVRLDEAQIWNTLAGRVILVTGAAGSIGSELCRQIASFQPRKLILLDQAESDLFRIDLELRSRFPALAIVPEIGDIRRAPRVELVMARHRVEVVFHAAAYKHVPLMESHAIAAVENNVFGTYNTAIAALEHGVKTFVLISSDKAVNPANVMGATKRATELIVSSLPCGDGATTRFVAVRFGNVLGSNGSVVPVFQKQIATGGPVTVTHPDVRRYFMTIREAVQLVLQASTMGKGSEIYVLDMGELIKIADLARNMIRLAGFAPDEEIEIRYVGLRPGEKLFEEIITEGENILPTHHEKIKIFKGAPASREAVEQWLTRMRAVVARQDEAGAVMLLKEMIPEYEVSAVWGKLQLAAGFSPTSALDQEYSSASRT